MTLTTDVGKLLSKLNQVRPKGDINFVSAIRIAHVRNSTCLSSDVQHIVQRLEICSILIAKVLQQFDCQELVVVFRITVTWSQSQSYSKNSCHLDGSSCFSIPGSVLCEMVM